MIVDTNRFGPLEVPDNKLITMERPLLGFEGQTRFCLIEIDDLHPFLWLQSVEDRNVAFLIVNPAVFSPDYKIVINPNEIAELKVTDVTRVETYVIVSINEKSGEIFANLQGPLLINNETRLAKQLVLVNSQYQVDEPILKEFTASRESEKEEELEYAL